jgi:hypothetical protein
VNDFLQVNLGNILTIASFLVGGTAFAYTIRNDVHLQGQRLGLLENEIRALREVVVSVARQDERMVAMEARLNEHGKRLYDIVQKAA